MDQTDISNIITDLKQGKTSRYAELVDEYQHMIYNLCLKITQSKEDAEEIAQDTFVKAFQGIHKFKGEAKFSTWLYQIAYFSAIGHLRKQKNKTHVELPFDLQSEASDALLTIHQNEQEHIIEEAMSYLKPDERAVISLFYLESMSVKDVAKITKFTTANVKVKVHRVKKKLRQILEQILKHEVNSLL